jgi:protein-S-isoprenylcysteine O-methyltransferase Ste14
LGARVQNSKLPEQTKGKIRVALLVAIVTVIVGFFMYFFTFTSVGYGNWLFVVMNIVFFSLVFLLTSFRKKLSRLPNSVYIAFIVALFAEMYGLPLTMYFFMGFFGYDKIFSLEFLLTKIMGQDLFYNVYHYYVFPASKFVIGFGMLLVIFGWYQIFKAKGELVKTGLYKYTRNPQYIGFLLITAGLNIQWLTIITTIIWPVLVLLYYQLAKKEEKESEAKYGEEFRTYKRTVPMFIPRLKRKN